MKHLLLMFAFGVAVLVRHCVAFSVGRALLFGSSHVQRPSGVKNPKLPRVWKSMLRMADVIDAEYSYNGSDETPEEESSTVNLVDLSLETDPEMKDIIVEFVEMMPSGNRKYIECKLPFTAVIDGTTYSIGTPHDSAVAILTDGKDGEVEMLDADDNSNEEIFQIAAAALVNNLGEDFRLKRTPRILTVDGDLDAYTRQYMNEGNFDTDDIMKSDDVEDDDKFLDDFFKEQLGPDFEEGSLDDLIDDEEAEELMKFFDIPGLGTQEEDEDGMKKMFDEMLSGENLKNEETENETTKALPLFPFSGPDGKMYAFVQLAHPMLLVGKENSSLDKDQRLLLNSEESAAILPRLKAEFGEINQKVEEEME
eukprot:CAMPEP_0183310352 /NCGR_PEP_ID=MMETSP0160_2-20130417/30954_1 /TAXON_ID=2839 ORGANISM="Odontella Sinensis, Strain Grunow 1884" /NCGR_SAMPLE_ID=MMETSP0160_2 /ASSEMBLY_ACC=CAM_ASM_000250 /LENGTH=365 /DNA_ID=CAMNT_0025474593 /DNA_START=17 /DNA_END=1114 /DNA_ORIENTATION=-